MKTIQKLILKSLILVLSMNLIFPATLFAAELGLLTQAPGSEYVSGKFPGAIMIPVNLWGPVAKPGIHYIPAQTDLLTLLSWAGGPVADAKMDEVLIKRRFNKEERVIRVDVDEIISSASARGPMLEANDVIVIPRERPVISQNTATVISIVGGLLGIALAGLAISNQVKSR